MEYNGLPVYKAEINAEDEGMFCISLVQNPAVEADFLAFDKDKELLKFTVENEEKRLVRGLVMAADFLIYRRTATGYEYYIQYSPEAIRVMAEKYLKDGFQNNVDTEHSFNLVEGVNMVSKSTKPNAKNPQGGIVKQEASVHLSNLNPLDPKTGKPTRVGRKLSADGTLVRYSKKSGEEIK